MTEKDLKKLSRLELIDIIYELQKRLIESEKESAALKDRLKDRELRISSSGSIAEAAIKLNGVFESAQAAADQYLQSVYMTNSDIKEKIDAAEKYKTDLIEAAKNKAIELLTAAEKKSQEIIREAEITATEKLKDFEKKATEFINLHDELKTLLKGIDS